MSARISVVLATFACLAGTCSSALAQSASHPMPTIRAAVAAGNRAYVRMNLTGPARRCQLVASVHGRRQHTLSNVRPQRARVSWRWQVPRRARSATWRVSTVCGSDHLLFIFKVHGARHRSVLSLARRIRVLQSGSPLPQATASSVSVAPANIQPSQPLNIPPAAWTWWTQSGPGILAGFHTGASAGQCTDYVASKRPDVIGRVDIWAYLQWLQTIQTGNLNVSWVAKDWASEAKQAGIPTGKVARPGAVVVFQPGSYGATTYGHVAFVDSVQSDGSFTISEMHAPVLGQITTRWFDPAAAASMRTDPGVDFIYW